MSSRALDDALERLYAAPLEQFMALRKELVVGLRAAGEKEAAGEIASAAKPTLTAWALNEVARRRPELLAALVSARDLAAATQSGGDAGQLRETARQVRARVADALDAAQEVLASAGHAANALQLRRMNECLQAAVAAPSDARTRLLAGRLVRDLAQEDPFAGMEVGEARPRIDVPRAATTAGLPPEPAAEKTRRDRERERRQAELTKAAEEAERALAELEVAAAGARAEARQAEVAAARAQDEASRARRAAGDLESRLQEARARAQAARSARDA